MPPILTNTTDTASTRSRGLFRAVGAARRGRFALSSDAHLRVLRTCSAAVFRRWRQRLSSATVARMQGTPDDPAGPDHHRHYHHHHRARRWARLRHRAAHAFVPHSHESADKVDSELEASAEGMRTLWLSLAVLALTTVVQAVVVVWSGSVARLGDTVHNAADALTAVPLG